MEEDLVKELFKYVLMESGDMCVVEVIGLLLMQKWCVTNWVTPQHVS